MQNGTLGSKIHGFTLIELMVAIAVLAILTALAVPAFVDFRERAAVRGAGDQLVSFWANARLEALKRDQVIAVTLRRSGADVCIGAATGTAACDCFSTNACNVAQYPSGQSEWRGVTPLGNPTLGPNDADAIGLAVIDPKRGYLSDDDDDGGVTIQSPRGNNFRLRFYVDRWARAYLCSPTDSPMSLPDYSNRTCAP
jgi:prepilin-type N-terminal cleavage/methylation domain-containing protein